MISTIGGKIQPMERFNVKGLLCCQFEFNTILDISLRSSFSSQTSNFLLVLKLNSMNAYQSFRAVPMSELLGASDRGGKYTNC